MRSSKELALRAQLAEVESARAHIHEDINEVEPVEAEAHWKKLDEVLELRKKIVTALRPMVGAELL